MSFRSRSRIVGVCLAWLAALALASPVRAAHGRGRVSVPGAGAAPAPSFGHLGEEIEGLVTAVDGTAGTLSVDDQRLGPLVLTVDASTVIRHGWTIIALADIVAGARVHAKASPQTGGVFLAGVIFVQNNGNGSGSGSGPGSGSGAEGSDTESEIQGTVKSIDCGSNTMTVTTDSGDVTVTFDSSTQFFGKKHAVAACADVAVGDTVEVEGTAQSDGSVLASKVSFEAPEGDDQGDDETQVEGTVKSIDCGSNTMTVTTDSGDVVVTFDTSTQFFTHDSPATCGDVATGDAVEVEGTAQSDGSVLASKVDFEAPEPVEAEVSGTIDTIDSGAQTFVLVTDQGNVTIATDSTTVILDGDTTKAFGDLATGMSVEVDGILQSDGSILAGKISIEESGDDNSGD